MPEIRNGKERNRNEAEDILAKMNDMLRERNFGKVIMDKRYCQLQEKLRRLGWLGQVKHIKVENGELHAQLKLEYSDSNKVRDLP